MRIASNGYYFELNKINIHEQFTYFCFIYIFRVGFGHTFYNINYYGYVKLALCVSHNILIYFEFSITTNYQ